MTVQNKMTTKYLADGSIRVRAGDQEWVELNPWHIQHLFQECLDRGLVSLGSVRVRQGKGSSTTTGRIG